MNFYRELSTKFSKNKNDNIAECYNLCTKFIQYYNDLKNDEKEKNLTEANDVYQKYSEICCRLAGGISNSVGVELNEKQTLLYNEAIASLKIILSKDPFDEQAIALLRQIGIYYALNKRTSKDQDTDDKQTDVSISILKNLLFYVPFDNFVHYYLALAYQKKNDLDTAILHFKTACIGLEKELEKNPKNEEVSENISKIYNSLGSIYYYVQNRELALTYFQRGLRYCQKNVDLYNQIGVVYTEMRLIDKALKYYNLAIDKVNKSQDNFDKNNMLASIYMNKGLCHCYECEFEEAIESYNTALRYNPKLSLAFQNKLLDVNYISHLIEDPMYIPNLHKKLNRLYPKVVTDWKESLPDYKPLELATVSDIKDFKELAIKTKRKLKIGFVSGDFICHPVSYFLSPILKKLDHSTFEIYGYTQKIMDLKGIYPNCKFFIVKGYEPDKLFDLIKSHGIDILFDMSGQTGDNRLDTFCLKPAPIQVSYCGYPGTTGLKSIDYHITDRYCDNEDTQRYYTEKLVFMDKCFLNYEPPISTLPEVVDEQPLIKNGYITFGCFNRLNKINKELVEVWEEILEKIPNARFVVKTKEFLTPHLLKKFKSFFKNKKVLERLVVLPYSDTLLDHLPDYNKMDIALDTFPYSGTTTSCEALYMGVPVLTLYDSEKMYHVQNVTTSLMINSDLEYYVAKTKAEYVQKAIALSNKPIEFFTRMKKHVRQKFIEGDVWKKEPFIEDFENKMFTIYKNHNW